MKIRKIGDYNEIEARASDDIRALINFRNILDALDLNCGYQSDITIGELPIYGLRYNRRHIKDVLKDFRKRKLI